TTGLRIPVSEPNSRRVENRVVGMDANPYLAMAACLACGYLGMKNKSTPREEVKGEAYELPHSLPRDVLTALRLFDECKDVQQILGEDFSKIFMAIKRHEHEEFLQVISPWEREHLLLNV
ncbi:MAG: glutamine synthetase, partial [Rhizobiaceae bacterium]|nr:glutamine synthetase [Rhizobiaceae bacterium]